MQKSVSRCSKDGRFQVKVSGVRSSLQGDVIIFCWWSAGNFAFAPSTGIACFSVEFNFMLSLGLNCSLRLQQSVVSTALRTGHHSHVSEIFQGVFKWIFQLEDCIGNGELVLSVWHEKEDQKRVKYVPSSWRLSSSARRTWQRATMLILRRNSSCAIRGEWRSGRLLLALSSTVLTLQQAAFKSAFWSWPRACWPRLANRV